jgi:polysaccharide pyruvyl transferase WcaK-like protein
MNERGRPQPEFSPHVAIISPSGWGNLGDSAIVESVIRAVRLRQPTSRIAGFTLNPPDTAERHGIPAFTCSGFSLIHYGVAEHAPFAAPVPRGAGSDGVPQAQESVFSKVPRLAWLEPARRAARSIRKDVRHRRWLSSHLRELRMVVIAGGGQLDDFWGGTFGHPYVLMRWARAARRRRARFVVLSVGTGSLTTPLARYFVRQALAAAEYRSFRDDGSRKLVGISLVASDPVVPDLAYGLPVAEFRRPRVAGARPVLALSPIAYCDPRSWPVSDGPRYRDYLKRVAELATGLLDAGYDLVLYGTDSPDLDAVDDLRAELMRLSPAAGGRVRTPPVRTHQELFCVLSEVDGVVASRLHGVLLAHLLDLPVFALSYERKVATLMNIMEQTELCRNIDDFEPGATRDGVLRMMDQRAAYSRAVAAIVAGFRERVEEQYDRVFGGRPS